MEAWEGQPKSTKIKSGLWKGGKGRGNGGGEVRREKEGRRRRRGSRSAGPAHNPYDADRSLQNEKELQQDASQ